MGEFLSRMGAAALNDLKGTPLDEVVDHLMGGQQGASGLEAFVEKPRSGGLEDRVESWISTGANRPMAPQRCLPTDGQVPLKAASSASCARS